VARASLLDEHLAAGDYSARMGVPASGSFDQPGNDTVPYTVQRAIDEFEFGLRCILDGIEAQIMGVGGQSERRASWCGPRRGRCRRGWSVLGGVRSRVKIQSGTPTGSSGLLSAGGVGTVIGSVAAAEVPAGESAAVSVGVVRLMVLPV